MWWLPISEINSSVSSIRKKYRIASIFIITPRDVERRESAPCFVRQTISWSSNESSRKLEKYDNQTIKFTHPAVAPTSFNPWICLHNTFAVRNLILRCLTGSHMTISSKSNYRVRLNVNMNIADSIPFYFNFGKGHYFVLRVKQHIFGKAQIFQINRLNPAIINWREKK